MVAPTVAHLLEGDGVLSNLYYFLWRVALIHGPNDAAAKCSAFRLPSTAVYENGFPKVLYCRNPSTGEFERRLGRDVDLGHMLREMAAQTDPSSHSSRDGEVVATFMSSVDVGDTTATRVEYFNRELLEDFVYRRSKRPDGILQKWVFSAGKSNSVYQVVWSPHVCMVHKKQNVLSMHDYTAPMHIRAMTFDGPAHCAADTSVAPHVQWQLKFVCEQLASKMLKVQRVAIQRMVMHFKIDHSGAVWFLYCSSMRVSDPSQLNLAPTYVVEIPLGPPRGEDADVKAVKILQEEDRRRQRELQCLLSAPPPPVSARIPAALRQSPSGCIPTEPPSQQQQHQGDSAEDANGYCPIYRKKRKPMFAPAPKPKAVVKSQDPPPADSRRLSEELGSSLSTPFGISTHRPSAFAQPQSPHNIPARTPVNATRGSPQLSRVNWLWDVVRLAVRTRYVAAMSRRTAAWEWVAQFHYRLYSHFNLQPHAGPIELPMSAALLGDDWPQQCSVDCDVDAAANTVRVRRHVAPLAAVRARLDELVQLRVDRPFAATRWYFTAHKFLAERRLKNSEQEVHQ